MNYNDKIEFVIFLLLSAIFFILTIIVKSNSIIIFVLSYLGGYSLGLAFMKVYFYIYNR